MDYIILNTLICIKLPGGMGNNHLPPAPYGEEISCRKEILKVVKLKDDYCIVFFTLNKGSKFANLY